MKNSTESRIKVILRKNPQLADVINKRKRVFFAKALLAELLIILGSGYVYSQLVLYEPSKAYIVWIAGAFLCVAAPFLFKPIATFKNEKYAKIISAEVCSRFTQRAGTVRGMTNTLVYCISFSDEREFVTELDLPKHHEKCFFEGDEILMLDALKYPINLTEHENVVCPYCGNVMPAVNRDCVGCGKYNIYKYR